MNSKKEAFEHEQLTKSLCGKSPYSYTCISSGFVSSTYQLMYNGKNIATVSIDPKNMENYVYGLNAAWKTGVADALSELSLTLSNLYK